MKELAQQWAPSEDSPPTLTPLTLGGRTDLQAARLSLAELPPDELEVLLDIGLRRRRPKRTGGREAPLASGCVKRSPTRLRDPWWTEADQAELDALLYRLVGAAFAHRDCARCVALNAWCGPMREAAEEFLDWRRGRQLLSRAEWLRERPAA